MSYKVKAELKNKFNPYITTVINGKVERVSVKDLETKPEKYAKTHLISFYQDAESIKKRLQKSIVKSAKVLNMDNVSRGDIFNKKFQIAKSIELMERKSALKRDRLKKRFAEDQKAEAKEAKAKKAAESKEAKAKKAAEAKKAAAKTEEEKAIEAAIEAGKK